MALWPVNGPAAGKKMPVTQEDLKKCRLEMVRRKVRWTEKLKTGRYEAGGAGNTQDTVRTSGFRAGEKASGDRFL